MEKEKEMVNKQRWYCKFRWFYYHIVLLWNIKATVLQRHEEHQSEVLHSIFLLIIYVQAEG